MGEDEVVEVVLMSRFVKVSSFQLVNLLGSK